MRSLLVPGALLTLAIIVAAPVALARSRHRRHAKPAHAEAKATTAVAPPPAKPLPYLPERVIEKTVGAYDFKVTLHPGNLLPNRVADVQVDLFKNLDTPDPTWGDRQPMSDSQPVATVQPSAGVGDDGAPAGQKYTLWPEGDPGHFEFHFTPPADGLYQITFSGTDKTASDDGSTGDGTGDDGTGDDSDSTSGATTFSASFRIGVGSSAPDTEKSQGVTSQHSDRAPVADDEDSAAKFKRVMNEIGQQYLDLSDGLRSGGTAANAAEARAIAALFAQVKGHVPADHSTGAAEFDQLADATKSSLAAVASALDDGNRDDARAALEKVEQQGCNECHAKYRFNVTDDLSSWPRFHEKLAHTASE